MRPAYIEVTKSHETWAKSGTFQWSAGEMLHGGRQYSIWAACRASVLVSGGRIDGRRLCRPAPAHGDAGRAAVTAWRRSSVQGGMTAHVASPGRRTHDRHAPQTPTRSPARPHLPLRPSLPCLPPSPPACLPGNPATHRCCIVVVQDLSAIDRSVARISSDCGTIHVVPLMAVLGRFMHWARRGQTSGCHECCFIG